MGSAARRRGAVLLVGLAAASPAACGEQRRPDRPPVTALPAGAVATVDREPVTEGRFRAQLRLEQYEATVRLIGAEAFRRTGMGLVDLSHGPDACVREIRRRVPRADLGDTTDASLEAGCAREATALRDAAFNELLVDRVVQAELPAAGGTVDAADERRQLRFVYSRFGGEAALERFTRATGISDADLRRQVGVILRSRALRAAVLERAGRPDDADLRRYYGQRPGRFLLPERRTVELLVVRGRGAAVTARRRIAAGESFGDVVRAVGTDPGTPVPDVRIGNARPEDLPDGTAAAAFGARPAQLVGPIRTPDGYAVLRVVEILDRVPEPFEQARARVRRALAVVRERERWVWGEYEATVIERWRPRIACVAPFRAVALCASS